jgi:peptide/nickel transport system substrate-binding protein
MRRKTPSSRWIAIAVAGASLALAAALSTSSPAAVDGKVTISAGHKCLVMTGSGDPAFVKNFNPYTATGLPSGSIVQGAFYEPLIVTGQGGLKPVPWLARSWKWSNGNKTLTLNLARNAKWSDGQRLDSADVVYSFLAGRQDKLMDRVGLTGVGNNIASVRARGPYKVIVKLKTPDSQFVAATINRLFVVPQHIWSKVNDIANFRNTRPVGSGPFTVITRFTAQSYVLGKNPRYWQKGMPKVPCMEYVRAASNDAALALIQSGQVDWTHNFVPNVETAYVAKDKKHFHAFYATTAYPVSLLLDTTKYPYSLAPFRKALSRAIDRNLVSKLGEYGYAPPTEAIGLNGLFPKWVTDKKVKARSKTMSTYSPSVARSILTGAGFTYNNGRLIDPRGDAVELDIHVIAGWSDWVASNQIITRNFRDIGIDSNVVLEPDWGAWQPGAYATQFPTLLWQAASQGSPYGYFYSNLSQNAHVPSGESGETTGNWSHFSDAKATTLLNKWKTTLNVKKQRQYSTQLQNVFLDHLPIVPIFIGPRWSTYSTRYFHCFGNKKNYFGDPIFTTFPDNILSFTRICPGGKVGP